MQPAAELEGTSLAAGPVRGNLLEAVDEVDGAGQVRPNELPALLQAIEDAVQLGAGEAAAFDVLLKTADLSGESGRGGEGDPERRVDLMRHPGHKLTEGGKLLGLDEICLSILELC